MRSFKIAFAWLLIGCSFSDAQIIIKGSDILGAKMIPRLAGAYQQLHPTISFEISSDGTQSGFDALLSGSCEIGMAFRPISQEELEQFERANLVLKKQVVGYSVIAVIVNAKNPVENLSLRQVQQVFTGDLTTWDQVGGKEAPIAVFTRNSSSGIHRDFRKQALDNKPYGKAAQRATAGGGLLTVVSETVNGIGCCGLAYASKKGIRKLRIDGVAPSLANVGNYAFSRELYLYSVGEVDLEVEKFIQWVRDSEQARKVIEKVGFIPFSSKVKREQGE